ncbi:hypothetical protein AX15_007045 [Amanita polypyramis BW_CC]|nr:hypothetical protein AX15_007045 [Amanita polypyramis BW_CC]
MASEQPITKRLHISGLTPALSATDISQRLSSFGTVKAIDGFGLLDGVGRPRKFGYVTIETTASKFARCCNSLSGTTWKGTKLRIGEAKPDFRERIAAENLASKREAETADEERRTRKRRRLEKYGAVHAEDMSLVTKENADGRPGWVVTPLGRVMRPMKMKPLRPLTDMDAKIGKGRKGKKGKVETRARRRKIDMLTYGSVQLKGVFMDVTLPEDARAGGLDEDKDGGFSAIGKDVGETDESGGESEGTEETAEDDEDEDPDEESGEHKQEDEVEDTRRGDEEPSNKTTGSTNKLQDLFAPQEEDAGFSLLGHLDLDLELDEDVPFPITTDPQPAPTTLPTAAQTQARTRTTPITQLDSKQPLFFPLRSSSTLGPDRTQARAKGRADKGRQRDLFDVAKEKGWNWRDPGVGFYRTETEEEIRKRWEGVKGELTREWKRRWREAGKVRRRRYGGVRADGE